MKHEFDIHYWNLNKFKLLKRFPKLTNADLIWRFESKDELFRSIADTVGITRKELEEIIDSQ